MPTPAVAIFSFLCRFVFCYPAAYQENLSQLRTFVCAKAVRDLVEWQKSDPGLGLFAEQALTARTWYQIDSAAIETILANMIENVAQNSESISTALNRASQQITLLMTNKD